MRWKYVTIFLMGLLCLVSGNEVFSQHCFKISYDKNGNRVSFIAKECDKYEKNKFYITFLPFKTWRRS